MRPLTHRRRTAPRSPGELGRDLAFASIALVSLACTPIADIAEDPLNGNLDGGGRNDASSPGSDGGAAIDAAQEGAALDAWPNESNTGWLPTGVTLTRHDGDLIIDVPGTVVDALDVHGTVYARAANVTVRRSRVYGQIDNESADRSTTFPGLTIEDVELDGSTASPSVNAYQAPVGRASYTARRCNVHGWGMAFRIGDGVTLQDDYVHDLVSQTGGSSGDSSNYAATSNGGSHIWIQHNNLDCSAPNCIGVLALYGDNAAIFDVTILHNLFNGGSEYCIYGGSVPGKPFPNATGVRFLENHFGRTRFSGCAAKGPVIDFDATGAGNLWESNVWDDTGAPLTP